MLRVAVNVGCGEFYGSKGFDCLFSNTAQTEETVHEAYCDVGCSADRVLSLKMVRNCCNVRRVEIC